MKKFRLFFPLILFSLDLFAFPIPWQELSLNAKNSAKCSRPLNTLINVDQLVEILKIDSRIEEKLGPKTQNYFKQHSEEEIKNILNDVIVYSGANMDSVKPLTGTTSYMLTLGREIYTVEDICEESKETLDHTLSNLLAHETIHVMQYETRGIEGFLIEYFIEQELKKIIYPNDYYMNNDFEKDAYAIGGRHYSILDSDYPHWMH